MAAPKKKVTPKVTEKKATEEKKVVSPTPEVKKEVKKKFSLKDLEDLQRQAKTLIIKREYDKVSELTDEPGVILKGFVDVEGIPRLRVKYEVEGETLVNKLIAVHNI